MSERVSKERRAMTARITQYLHAVKERAEKATPGPWGAFPGVVRFETNELVEREGLWHILSLDDVEQLPLAVVDREKDEDDFTRFDAAKDAAFIAAARTDVEVLERMLREAVEALRHERENDDALDSVSGIRTRSIPRDTLARIEAMVPKDSTTGG